MTSDLALKEPYYAECQRVFKAATNQNERMLAALAQHSADLQDFDILSVGSGSGLFELPMLAMFSANGQKVRHFIGVDPDADASQKLEEALQARFDGLDFKVVTSLFEDFEQGGRVDLVLYNHVFEYMRKDRSQALRRSLAMLRPGGRLLLFSPLRGGINQPYEENMENHFGYKPMFSDDIETLLRDEDIEFEKQAISAQCDISLLEDLDSEGDGMRLLCFLMQIDCRILTAKKLGEAVAYYQSFAEDNHIPHPADLYILR